MEVSLALLAGEDYQVSSALLPRRSGFASPPSVAILVSLMRSLVMRAIRCSGYTATVAGVEARAQYDS
jgi:hypothetical protein